jgi:ribosomal protein L2
VPAEAAARGGDFRIFNNHQDCFSNLDKIRTINHDLRRDCKICKVLAKTGVVVWTPLPEAFRAASAKIVLSAQCNNNGETE